MGQHYVPQYYLEGFTDIYSKIHQYEKGKITILSTATQSVANENHRWSSETENYLANQIEVPANPVLKNIRNKLPINQLEKEVLAAYMVVLLRRVPKGWQRTKKFVPEFFDNLENLVLKLMEEHPAKIDILKRRQLEIKELRTKWENEFPSELWSEYLKPDYTPQILAALPAMTWTFLVSERGIPFLTNDNPVFFFEGLGIGKTESEVIFPVSSSVTLFASWKANFVEGYVSAKEVIIREINRRTASNTTKYAFYSREANWVVNLINKKHYKLYRIN